MSQIRPDTNVSELGDLAFDAVPRRPRVTIEDVLDDESHPDESYVQNVNTNRPPRQKRNFKKPFLNIWHGKNKEKINSSDTKKKSPFSSPVATQATGNVVNIVNSNNVHCGPAITYNIGSPGNDEKSMSSDFKVKKTKSVSAIMHSTDEVTYDYLNIVSKNIGSGWKDICRSLSGISEGRIELLCENHKLEGISEVIYQILLDWVRNEDGNLGKLTTHLWQEGKRELVREMAAFYKIEQLENQDELKSRKH